MNGTLHLLTRIASFSGKQTWNQLNYGAWLAAKAWPAVVARGNLAMLKFDEEKTLPHIEVPVLVVAGSHDRMTTPPASDQIEKRIPGGRQIRLQTGHLGLWEQGHELAALIGEFVNLHSRGEAGRRVPAPSADTT
jgi:pimeloyl-ACP methyl ester carboxylesterase